jgi:hypothetical protein
VRDGDDGIEIEMGDSYRRESERTFEGMGYA